VKKIFPSLHWDGRPRIKPMIRKKVLVTLCNMAELASFQKTATQVWRFGCPTRRKKEATVALHLHAYITD
jgi:hypothetical protein